MERLIADVPESSVLLTSFQRSRDSTHKDRLSGIQWQGSVEDKVGIRQLPRSDLHRFVLDGGGRDAQVQLIIVLDAGVNQLLYRDLIL